MPDCKDIGSEGNFAYLVRGSCRHINFSEDGLVEIFSEQSVQNSLRYLEIDFDSKLSA